MKELKQIKCQTIHNVAEDFYYACCLDIIIETGNQHLLTHIGYSSSIKSAIIMAFFLQIIVAQL